VMGLTEYVMEIRQELRTIRADISPNITAKMRPDSYFSKPVRDPVEVRRQSLELADKVERLLAMDQSPEVDLAKEELRRTVEKNFLRMLAAILVTGPTHTQEKSDDIFKLMRSVLNGELDFTPVVQRLPLILRDSETNQFVNLLITLRESERGNSGRQTSLDNTVQMTGKRQGLGGFPTAAQLLNSLQNPGQLLSGYQSGSNLVAPSQSVVTTSQNGQQVISGTAGVQTPQQQLLQQQLLQQQLLQQQIQQQQQITPGQNQNLQTISTVNGQQTVTQTDPTQTPNRNQLPSINSILEGITQANQLVKEIPSLVEGLQTIVESIEGIFG